MAYNGRTSNDALLNGESTAVPIKDNLAAPFQLLDSICEGGRFQRGRQ